MGKIKFRQKNVSSQIFIKILYKSCLFNTKIKIFCCKTLCEKMTRKAKRKNFDDVFFGMKAKK
jgi:hypothetical protein